MRLRPSLLAATLLFAACAPPPPPPPRHRCVEIPNGLVECSIIEDPEPPAAAR